MQQRAAEQRQLAARLEQSEEEVGRLRSAQTRVAELSTEIEALRSSERYANLQAQMQTKRAEETAREAALLHARLDALASGAAAAPTAGAPSASNADAEPPPLTGSVPTATNSMPTPTGGSGMVAVTGEEAGVAAEVSTTLVEDAASTSARGAPQLAASPSAAATSAASPSSVHVAGGVAMTGGLVGSDSSIFDGANPEARAGPPDLSTTTTPLPSTPTAAAPPPPGGPTPTPAPTAGSADGGMESDAARRERRILLGAQTRALLHAQTREASLLFIAAHSSAAARRAAANGAPPLAGGSESLMTRTRRGINSDTFSDDDDDDDIKEEAPDERAEARRAHELREALQEARADADAKSAELDASHGDLQVHAPPPIRSYTRALERPYGARPTRSISVSPCLYVCAARAPGAAFRKFRTDILPHTYRGHATPRGKYGARHVPHATPCEPRASAGAAANAQTEHVAANPPRRADAATATATAAGGGGGGG